MTVKPVDEVEALAMLSDVHEVMNIKPETFTEWDKEQVASMSSQMSRIGMLATSTVKILRGIHAKAENVMRGTEW